MSEVLTTLKVASARFGLIKTLSHQVDGDENDKEPGKHFCRPLSVLFCFVPRDSDSQAGSARQHSG